MIITYPIQIPYTKGREQRVVPDAIFDNSEILSGSYPMGKNRFWHGGVHIHPNDRSAPIRAIADGEILAYRYDEIDVTDPYFEKAPYSRSFVLLRHKTELGQTTVGTATLTFYSLYMHLQAWGQVKSKNAENRVNFLRKFGPKDRLESATPSADGACHDGSGYARVQRGDILGYCGSIPDNMSTPSRGIHFEIFFDDVAFLDNPMKTVWGKCVLSSRLEVLKELLPKETSVVDPARPLNSTKEESGDGFQKIIVDKKSYWVSNDQIISTEIDIPHPKNKKINIKQTQYFSNGKRLECYRKNPVKNKTILAAGTRIIPWLDPWMTVGEFREETVDTKTWVQIYVPDTNDLYWAEKSAIHYYSDADWREFHSLEEKGTFSEDGFIDDDGIQKLFDAYEKDRADKNLPARKDDEATLRYLIARHPTEWSKQDIRKRFGRVMQEEFGASKLTPEQFSKLTAHIERLSFWEQVPGLPAPKLLWHAHPIKFIEHLAKCMWLSKEELQLIYPEKTGFGEAISHGTANEIREKYRVEINKCCYRYGVSSRLRQAHFFGQGAAESRSLNQMVEIASGSKYENSRDLGNCCPGDGSRFKGRGFKQLTGRFNYSEYWCFKGWLKKGIDFDIGWERDLTKRYPPVEKPEILIETPFNCIDSGCWYIALFRKTTVAAMDLDDVKKVTEAINGGDIGLKERSNFTDRIRKQIL